MGVGQSCWRNEPFCPRQACRLTKLRTTGWGESLTCIGGYSLRQINIFHNKSIIGFQSRELTKYASLLWVFCSFRILSFGSQGYAKGGGYERLSGVDLLIYTHFLLQNGCLGLTLMTQLTAHYQQAIHFSPHSASLARTVLFIISISTTNHCYFHDWKCTINLITPGGERGGRKNPYHIKYTTTAVSTSPHLTAKDFLIVPNSFHRHPLWTSFLDNLSQDWPLPVSHLHLTSAVTPTKSWSTDCKGLNGRDCLLHLCIARV